LFARPSQNPKNNNQQQDHQQDDPDYYPLPI